MYAVHVLLSRYAYVHDDDDGDDVCVLFGLLFCDCDANVFRFSCTNDDGKSITQALDSDVIIHSLQVTILTPLSEQFRTSLLERFTLIMYLLILFFPLRCCHLFYAKSL